MYVLAHTFQTLTCRKNGAVDTHAQFEVYLLVHKEISRHFVSTSGLIGHHYCGACNGPNVTGIIPTEVARQ